MSRLRRFAPLLLLIAVLLLDHQSAASTWQEHGTLDVCATKQTCEEQNLRFAPEGKSDIFAEGVAAASDSAVPTDAAATDGSVPPLADSSDAQTGQKQSRADDPESEAGVTELEQGVTQSEDVIRDGESSTLSEVNVTAMRHQVEEMFYHAYDGYKRFAFPQDELKPLSCSGSNPYGGMAMTLMESLGTLLLLDNVSEFNWGVEYLSHHLSFHKAIQRPASSPLPLCSSIPCTPRGPPPPPYPCSFWATNVFEANIRALGSLLSAHMLILQSHDPTLPPVHPSLAGVHLAPGYKGRLLELAIDLGFRLLPAFSSGTPIPYAWVNLRRGVLPDDVTHTCTAGAGTLLLEFSALSNISGIPIFQSHTAGAGTLLLEFSALSNLSGIPIFHEKAEAAVVALYRRRSPLNLVGNGISSTSGGPSFLPSSLIHSFPVSLPPSSPACTWPSTPSLVPSIIPHTLSSDATSMDPLLSLSPLAFVPLSLSSPTFPPTHPLSLSGVWLQRESTAGAGVDSFFEVSIDLVLEVYSGAMRYMAVRGESMVRWLLDVGIDNGHLGRHYASSLQAFWPAMQVLAGQTADARVIHSGLWAVWKRFSFLPELFSVTASAVHPVYVWMLTCNRERI
ncbi:unnamed protein product [Closterium sp. NIES-65]|nr:unnamed protein product [Closterium sp. NIES-65]